MSFIQSTLKCEDCGYEMNVAFGIVGTTQIAGWPKECPKCKSDNLIKIGEGWNEKPKNSNPTISQTVEERVREILNIVASNGEDADDYENSMADSVSQLKNLIKEIGEETIGIGETQSNDIYSAIREDLRQVQRERLNKLLK